MYDETWYGKKCNNFVCCSFENGLYMNTIETPCIQIECGKYTSFTKDYKLMTFFFIWATALYSVFLVFFCLITIVDVALSATTHLSGCCKYINLGHGRTLILTTFMLR